MICPRCRVELPDGAICPSCLGAANGSFATIEKMLTRTHPAGTRISSGSSAVEFRPGTVIAGRYRIMNLAGRGGMGEVYRAKDLKLDQEVALKFLPEEVGRDDEALSRLLNEVRSARKVSHPNVCRVFHVEEADGRHFLSMEYIAGEDLASLLKRRGRFPPETAVPIARQLCAGLAAAHDTGVLHRDLKPSNVMIDDRGMARIADFGLAEISTAIGGVKAREGTPFYMSPEQLSGQGATRQSDLYSLGLVLYEIFAGCPAYPGGNLEELIRSRQHAPPSPLSMALDLHPAVARMVLRCLETDPSRRPSSARAVAAGLPGSDPLAATEAAQQRADRIAAFRAELNDLRRGGLVHLSEEELSAVEKYHEATLRELVRTFDVDVSERGKYFSLGMRVVSLLGALALAASLFYFFYRIWGILSLPLQVGFVVAVPAGALLVMAIVASRERAGYFTAMAGMFALAGLALDTTVLSSTFNIPFSFWQFLSWGIFAMTLAYAYRLRLLLAAGALALALFLAGSILAGCGSEWAGSLERWETFFPAGVLAMLLPAIFPHRGHPGFAPLYRIFGLVLIFLPAIILAHEGELSYLPLSGAKVRIVYQLLGFGGSAAAIWLGIARREKEMVYGGSAAFVILLYSKFASWWWEWMPKYLFFLIVGLTAILVVLILKRLRAVMSAAAEVTP